MLRKNKRIPGNLFKEVFNEGEFVSTSFFSAKIKKDENFTHSYFAYVIPRKLVKKPVKRNYLRRKGCHVLKEVIKEPHQPWAIIIFVKTKALDLSYKNLNEELRKVLGKAGLFG